VTIVVGYVPSAEGRAALRRALAEARLRGTDLLVLNTVRKPVDDPGYAPVQELELVRSQLAASGVVHELRQVARGDQPAEEIVHAAAEVGARADRDRAAQTQRRGEVPHLQHRPADPARCPVRHAGRHGR
jgi:nucleotide-binding universal stress UspA family protein